MNPYNPPSAPPAAAVAKRPRDRNKGCVIGGSVGGCLIPFVLLVITGIAGDTGGLLFWPVLVIFLGFIGMIIGCALGPRRKPAVMETEEDEVKIKQ